MQHQERRRRRQTTGRKAVWPTPCTVMYCVVWNRQRKAVATTSSSFVSVCQSPAAGHGVELTDYHDFDWFGLLSPVISSRQCSAKYRALVSRFGCERIAEARRQT
jgi:hypothetical protein